MLRLILPILLLLAGLGAGVGAGVLLRAPAPEETAEPENTEAETETEAEAEAETDTARPPEQGAPGQSEFVRLNNQFIVPIVRDGTVRSLVILSLSVEVDLGNTELVFSQEPRLRDSFLQVLFAHANAGGFDGGFTQAIAMDPLRVGLRDAATQVLGAIARDVLIIDITRQDA
jgi:flagellar protein FliL